MQTTATKIDKIISMFVQALSIEDLLSDRHFMSVIKGTILQISNHQPQPVIEAIVQGLRGHIHPSDVELIEKRLTASLHI